MQQAIKHSYMVNAYSKNYHIHSSGKLGPEADVCLRKRKLSRRKFIPGRRRKHCWVLSFRSPPPGQTEALAKMRTAQKSLRGSRPFLDRQVARQQVSVQPARHPHVGSDPISSSAATRVKLSTKKGLISLLRWPIWITGEEVQ